MTPLFWVCATALLLIAVGFLAGPLWRGRYLAERSSRNTAFATLAVVPIALGLYFLVTSYDAELDFERGRNPEVIAALEQLATRLGANPDDIAGWTLLGRSYMELGEYELARAALQEAWTRTPTPDDSLKLAYAEALLQSDPATLTMAGDLIDEVLETSPTNQRALWWGGVVAVERNEPALAARRWTALLATNPPPEVAALLQEQIAVLAAAAGSPVPAAAATGVAAAGPVLAIEIAVAPDMPVAALGPTAIVYLLARAPGGGPPLAAKQIPLSALPGQFELGVADAMIPGRTLEGQDRVTIIARISLSGEPTEQPGDIFGQAEVEVASGEPVRITIDSVVPSA